MHHICFKRTKAELLNIWIKRTLLRKRMLFLMLIAIGGSVFLWFAGGAWRYLGVGFGFAALYAPVGAIGAFSRILRTTPDLTQPMTVSFGESGLMVHSTVQKVEITWHAFSGCSETPDHFLLSYRGTPIELVLPKRAFTAQQTKAFSGYLKRIDEKSVPATTSAV